MCCPHSHLLRSASLLAWRGPGTYLGLSLTPSLALERRWGARAFASKSKARKKQKKAPFKYTLQPSRFGQQKDGDFPVQLRPPAQREILDLHDAALDADAAKGFDDRPPRIKPHRVREAVRQQEGSVPLNSGDLTKLRDLRDRHVRASEIKEFDAARDGGEEFAADMAAGEAKASKAQARRSYKWMPNPHGSKPGALGTSAEAQAKYYERYFDGSRPSCDVMPQPTQDFKDPGKIRPKRERVYPKRFWYKLDYVTPAAENVGYMNSKELKFALVNESHLVRKWRNSQPDGWAAGIPASSEELWMAFGYRAADLARGVAAEKAAFGFDKGSQEEPKKLQRCSLCTALRYLQAFGHAQAGPYTALQRIVARVLQDLESLKPRQCFFFLQALSRLRLRHPKTVLVLERMSLAWPMLPKKMLVRAANAVAKLDIGSHLWARPLKLALAESLPQLPGRVLANLKSISVMDLLDEPAALQAYFEQCLACRGDIWYTRHLQVVELHVHLLYPDVWNSLSEEVRHFLHEVRMAAEQSAQRNDHGADASSAEGGDKGAEAGDAEQSGAAGSGSELSDSDSDAEDRPSAAGRRRALPGQAVSSTLHEDVSRVLRSGLGVEHHNGLHAGPLIVDIFHEPTKTVVEAAAPWQFYLRSAHVTALARRRHELLRAMGFRLVHVPYHRWEVLTDDEAKAALLRSLLPAEVLPPRRGGDRSPAAEAQDRGFLPAELAHQV